MQKNESRCFIQFASHSALLILLTAQYHASKRACNRRCRHWRAWHLSCDQITQPFPVLYFSDSGYEPCTLWQCANAPPASISCNVPHTPFPFELNQVILTAKRCMLKSNKLQAPCVTGRLLPPLGGPTHAPPFNPKFKFTLSLARNYSTLSSI